MSVTRAQCWDSNIRPRPGPHSSRAARLYPVRHPKHKTYQTSLPTIQRRAAQSPQNCRHREGKEHKTRSRNHQRATQRREARSQRRKARRTEGSNMARRRYKDMPRFPRSIRFRRLGADPEPFLFHVSKRAPGTG